MEENQTLCCVKCGVPLEMAPVKLHYLGHSFTQELPRCPVCGQMLVPEELVEDKIQPVEITLEDK